MAGAFPNLLCHPPLEQLSILPAGQDEIPFVVDIKWSITRTKYPFQVRVCTAESGSQQHPSVWQSFALSKSTLPTISFCENDKLYSQNFEGTIPRHSLADSVSTHHVFTVKYRIANDTAWQWILTPAGIQKGEIIFQTTLSTYAGVDSLVALEPGWQVAKINNVHENASLFSLSIQSADDSRTRVLGKPLNQSRYFAVSRIEPPWIAPRHGDSFLYLEEQTILVSILREDGNVVTIAAPTLGAAARFLLSNELGQLVVHSQGDSFAREPCKVMLCIAPDLETSFDAIMDHVRSLVNELPWVKEMTMKDGKLDQPSTSHLEPLLDHLGFCTWNALGPDLNEPKILDALEDLRTHNINISTVLIDDNWQTLGPTALDYDEPQFRGFADFKANAEFSHGLDGLLNQIKAENPNIANVGVWHALMGYWGALANEGWINDNYQTVDVDGKMYYAVPTKLRSVSAADLDRFYDDFYAYLKSCGIGFVKTDVQCLINSLQDRSDRASLIPKYQSSWILAHSRRLGGKAISCMSQIPELLWQGLLQNQTAPVIFRNSDDYFPEIPSSHMWHIWTNAHNTLFTQHLNAVLDWDMFQTSHEYGPIHAASRCLSGGPIFFTDTPGHHNLQLLDQVVAPSPDRGLATVLRPTTCAKTPRAFDRYQESGVLKIVTETATGTKLMGIFNTRSTSVASLVSLSEFSLIGTLELDPKVESVLFSHQSQTIRGPFRMSSDPSISKGPSSLIEVNLEVKSFEILSAHPTHRAFFDDKECLVAVLGLMGKFTGAAAICSIDVASSQTGIYLSIVLKALGKLSVWFSDIRLAKQHIKAKLGGEELSQHIINVSETTHGGRTSRIVILDLLDGWMQKERDTSCREVLVELALEP